MIQDIKQNHQYCGEVHPYAGSHLPFSGNDWGAYQADLPGRERRPRPKEEDQCPLCYADGSEEDLNQIPYRDGIYLEKPNRFPILNGQTIIFPECHRVELKKVDFEFIVDYLKTRTTDKDRGSTGTNAHPISGKASAIYVNPTAGSGRSVPHLHFSSVPSDIIPLPELVMEPWSVCVGMGDAKISRFRGLPFYVLTVHGCDRDEFTTTAALLHLRFTQWKIDYNLFAFTYPDEPDDVRVAFIPRSTDYSTVADQRIAGLEFLTGVLIPGSKHQAPLSISQRDQAFQEVTLSPDQALELERRLRRAFGSGYRRAVYAVPHPE